MNRATCVTRRYAHSVGPGSNGAQNPVQVGLPTRTDSRTPGTLDFVDNQVNPQTGTIRRRAPCLQNKDGHSRRACSTSAIVGERRIFAILIGGRAVNHDQDQKYVLRLGANNQIEYRKVKLGRVIQGLRIVARA